jgi:hypothetical protein
MSYQVDKFNGQFLVSVADGSIDTSTDLRLVGKNYAGYGEIQNENFLHLLENFSNTTSPPKAIVGQLWYDSENSKLKFFNGTRYKVAGGAEVSNVPPAGSTIGDLWWDTTTSQLYSWGGSEYTLVGPAASPDLGLSYIISTSVKGTQDTDVGPHSILQVISDERVIGIFSNNEFILDSSLNLIENFSRIKKGFTLINSQTGISTNEYIMWGTAENANLLGGIASSQYVRRGENQFTGEVSFKDPGFSVGDDNDLRVRVENTNEVIIENRLGTPINFRITVADVDDERDVAVIKSTGVVPGENNRYTLGESTLRWNNVHSATFTGNLLGNVTGNSTGVHTGNVLGTDGTVFINAGTKEIGYPTANIIGTLTGSVLGSATNSENANKLNNLISSIPVPSPLESSIPVRNGDGNIIANRFIGVTDRSERILVDTTGVVSDPVWDNSNASTQYRTAKITAIPYSVVARNQTGDVTANLFNGTATAARYADLAEKYLTDKEYMPGTVVSICSHQEHEVESCSLGQRAIGVVSTNPAFMMNKDLKGGTYIALKGRVPCKVLGVVKKGDKLIAGNHGCAIAGTPNSTDVFAIALAHNVDAGVKVIEVLVL